MVGLQGGHGPEQGRGFPWKVVLLPLAIVFAGAVAATGVITFLPEMVVEVCHAFCGCTARGTMGVDFLLSIASNFISAGTMQGVQLVSWVAPSLWRNSVLRSRSGTFQTASAAAQCFSWV